MISELGGNWSSGERQLICCARILLKREFTRVIAFDEASSSVDKATDEKLQQALRDHLGAATVITIAHRLNTIMHSDLIAVMDAGKVVEWGAPQELLKNSNGMLSELVAQAEHNNNGSTDA
jgi:ABC-type multidrug transport system fused ATPase/permease subunit